MVCRKGIRSFFSSVIFFALVCIVSYSCRKTNPETLPAGEEAILFPFRLENALDSTFTIRPRSLYIDSKGTKWIVYTSEFNQNGIIRFDGNAGNRYPNPQQALPSYSGGTFEVQTEDAAGGLYFTSGPESGLQQRLYRYQEGQWLSWDISAIPCRNVFFNAKDGKLYFLERDQVHRISAEADFSDVASYEKVTIDLASIPPIIQSDFDGENFHLISADRYFVVAPDGEVLFYSTSFDEISFSYMYASDVETSVYTMGGPGHQHIYKLHEGRWARYPLSNLSLASITVDKDEKIFVTTAAPDYYAGRYQEGIIYFYTYGEDRMLVRSSAPVAVDSRNVKWVAVPEGLVRLP